MNGCTQILFFVTLNLTRIEKLALSEVDKYLSKLGLVTDCLLVDVDDDEGELGSSVSQEDNSKAQAITTMLKNLVILIFITY